MSCDRWPHLEGLCGQCMCCKDSARQDTALVEPAHLCSLGCACTWILGYTQGDSGNLPETLSDYPNRRDEGGVVEEPPSDTKCANLSDIKRVAA